MHCDIYKTNQPAEMVSTLLIKKKFTHNTYSATTVLPAEVCADTNTDWLLSTQSIDSSWKGSNVNGYFFAGSPVLGCNGT